MATKQPKGPSKKKGELEAREAARVEQPEGIREPARASAERRSRSQAGAGPARGKQVDDLMKSPPQACHEGQSVNACARIMESENIGFVPICDEAGRPIGTITDRDLALRIIAKGKSADTKVEEVMTREVVSCRRGADLAEAERLMRERRKSRMMICDDDGKLVGVISLSDIAELEDEETAGEILRDVASREAEQPHAS